jgi:DNA-binding CsgD family transcriptional regulator
VERDGGFRSCLEACDDLTALSLTERQSLEAFSEGLSRIEISGELGLSVRTVGHSLTIAKEKLGGRSLAHAAVILGLLKLSCPQSKRDAT